MFDGKKGCLQFKLICTHFMYFTLYPWRNQEPIAQEYELMVYFKEVYKLLLSEFLLTLTPCGTTIEHEIRCNTLLSSQSRTNLD